MEELKQMIEGKGIRVLFTEGWDIRVLKAAVRLQKENLLHPVLNGSKKKIHAVAQEHNINIEQIEIIDYDEFDKLTEMVLMMVELRKGRVSEEECFELLKQPNYFSTMCLIMGYAQGMVGGATISTRDTLRAALQLVKTKQGCDIVSSSFFMIRGDERYIMGDCSLNINPSVDELVDITMQSAQTAQLFGIKPKIALLSYSTLGSGSGESVNKVREAVKRLQRLPLTYEVEGEMQLDAAVVKSVAQLKAPDSHIGGEVNTFVFPNLDAGNIGYKLMARFGGFEAIGPILQGLSKPLNDLSRGANVEEIFKMAIVTAVQSYLNV